jgi:hypothetical protein
MAWDTLAPGSPPGHRHWYATRAETTVQSVAGVVWVGLGVVAVELGDGLPDGPTDGVAVGAVIAGLGDG